MGCDGYRPRHHTGRQDFNPRTPCGVRHAHVLKSHSFKNISIHAPRVGCDFPVNQRGVTVAISIHAPRVGCDLGVSVDCTKVCTLFQSTHPVWGATPSTGQRQIEPKDFNPRTPCGVRRDPSAQADYRLGGDFNPRTPCGVRHLRRNEAKFEAGISIHAPRVGCDQII